MRALAEERVNIVDDDITVGVWVEVCGWSEEGPLSRHDQHRPLTPLPFCER